MNPVKAAMTEVFGLFVEDGSLAVAVLVWLVLTGLLVRQSIMSTSWGGIILFAGLVVILLENTLRRARHRKR